MQGQGRSRPHSLGDSMAPETHQTVDGSEVCCASGCASEANARPGDRKGDPTDRSRTPGPGVRRARSRPRGEQDSALGGSMCFDSCALDLQPPLCLENDIRSKMLPLVLHLKKITCYLKNFIYRFERERGEERERERERDVDFCSTYL